MHALNFDDFLHLLGWENGDSRDVHLEEGVTTTWRAGHPANNRLTVLFWPAAGAPET